MDAALRFVVDNQAKESGKEARRVTKEKRLQGIAKFVFLIRSSFRAWRCTSDYIWAVRAGGSNIFCICGYHPSRRKIRMFLTEETTAKDLEMFSKGFGTLDTSTRAGRVAMFFLRAIDAGLFLRVFDSLRANLGRIDAVKTFYAGMLPESVDSVVERFCAGRISAEQADDELIELKGHYEAMFDKLGIKPAVPMIFVGGE